LRCATKTKCEPKRFVVPVFGLEVAEEPNKPVAGVAVLKLNEFPKPLLFDVVVEGC